jgi:anti-anti-sigma factor
VCSVGEVGSVEMTKFSGVTSDGNCLRSAEMWVGRLGEDAAEAQHCANKEVLPMLSADRPQIVFDMSKIQHLDSIGVGIFLQCICQVAKNDGEIKLGSRPAME